MMVKRKNEREKKKKKKKGKTFPTTSVCLFLVISVFCIGIFNRKEFNHRNRRRIGLRDATT